jgi:predicted AAA+ superfamily ATPase
MFSRTLSAKLLTDANFPGMVVSGPRQSGKTTLVRQTFPKHRYVTFDDEFARNFASDDPERFLLSYENEHGIVIDEFQYVPRLIPYIKMAMDTKRRPGYFVLTGSQNFLANQAVTESLAGRVCILNLLPLSIQEMQQNNLLLPTVDEMIFQGGYPRLYFENVSPATLYSSYVQSYLERDVRQLVNVGDISLFNRFVQLCAGRSGQELNYTALSNDCGIALQTVKSWISILEASYIIFLLRPYFTNFNSRLTKTPKLYFFDTGLACSLLGIQSAAVLGVSPFRGALFENFIITDLYKQYCNKGMRPPLYFWREKGGYREVDCIIDDGFKCTSIEIKSAQTFSTDFFKGLDYWNKIAEGNPENGYVVYGGNAQQQRRQGCVVGWEQAGTLVDAIEAASCEIIE